MLILPHNFIFIFISIVLTYVGVRTSTFSVNKMEFMAFSVAPRVESSSKRLLNAQTSLSPNGDSGIKKIIALSRSQIGMCPTLVR